MEFNDLGIAFRSATRRSLLEFGIPPIKNRPHKRNRFFKQAFSEKSYRGELNFKKPIKLHSSRNRPNY